MLGASARTKATDMPPRIRHDQANLPRKPFLARGLNIFNNHSQTLRLYGMLTLTYIDTLVSRPRDRVHIISPAGPQLVVADSVHFPACPVLGLVAYNAVGHLGRPAGRPVVGRFSRPRGFGHVVRYARKEVGGNLRINLKHLATDAKP